MTMYMVEPQLMASVNVMILDDAVGEIRDRYGDEAIKAVMFYGSRVNGYEKYGSDLDCFVVLNEGYEQDVGMEISYVDDTELHVIAHTPERFERNLKDSLAKTSEHINTTVFRYDAPIGSEYIAQVDAENKHDLTCDILDDIAYLARDVESDTPVYFHRNDVADTKLVQHVLALPVLTERLERVRERGNLPSMLDSIRDSYQPALDRLEEEGVVRKVEEGENPLYEYTGHRGGSIFHNPIMKGFGRKIVTPFLNVYRSIEKRGSGDFTIANLGRALKHGPRYVESILEESVFNLDYAKKHREILVPYQDEGLLFQGMSVDDLIDVNDRLQRLRRERNALKEKIRGDPC